MESITRPLPKSSSIDNNHPARGSRPCTFPGSISDTANSSFVLANSANQTQNDHPESHFVSGWVSQPNTRGTIDIVWTCLVTIFLCTWTVLCLNVPAESESQLIVLARKARWMAMAIIVPEFVLGFAAGQYENAYIAVKEFKGLGYSNWTMQHAFFADMGGFILCPRDSKPFPMNNKHIQWLVMNDFLDFPNVTTRDIWDRSKADHLLKSMVCIQICWLMVNVIARAIQHLAITTLELATVSIVFCTVATFFCWFHKPADVRSPILITMKSSTAEILLAAGDAARKPYRMTPLDFVDNLGPSWSANVMAFAGVRSGPQQRPLPRLTNDRFPHVRGLWQILIVTITLFTDGVHIYGWRFEFPTRAERVLWRVTSLQMFITATFFWGAELFAGLHRDHIWELLTTMILHPSQVKDLKIMSSQRPKRPPETLALPWECRASLTMWVLYLVARAYVLAEMFAGLRTLPQSAYVCIKWSDFLPHV